ncbi:MULTISPECIES: 4-hydroxy-tetrahydrodipicolinate synthase [unclassified Thermosynechococcus]|uniref:4-hydroxy-tetrahydrodipicolinate synthase n=1 Tax=unclassified Thermosynechococcus TaxID=2622553 RepID=UPI00267235A1|nr:MULTISPECIES: 4-hydroxy-tetrahydrodipicolinate synthase [unclassified Thermosynechococcus]WKT82172.1 4-hydroxy-tetrahydrodipicolinate synthase [Thermosynechococcus sp. PP45]WNC25790.1 4-hydroxy-tetrahydrodipicolinate synthase [Thermosynechococcus sp. PP551]WNC28369.1 4-hydroxy-tetrahydrodipicolinate synthase [Thermosynechococcus sp. PP555]WNC30933.1 4-hydroxy-tetrahydrodipicolinate synthase [Thermosynechococcus sp. PKX82]WNC33470.1 4-hydroxy-tetrahydrodipicolinate synthase [Thermosynechococ
MTDFGRVITAMITPFTEDGAIAYDVAAELAQHLVANGSDGIVVCGTTGESPTLTWEEEFQLFQTVQQAVAGKAKVIAGTGSNSTREAIHATAKAAELGLDGALLVVPYYNKPPQEGLYAHFQAIAKAVPDFPLMLYNIPGRTGQNLLPETVIRLAEYPNIIAIKEASGNLDQASTLRAQLPPHFRIYSGDDSLTLPLLAVGGYGVVSVASHLVGRRIQEMIQAFIQGDTATATAIHCQLLPLFKVLFVTTNPIPIKAALSLQGWAVGAPRLPLTSASDAVIDQLKPVLDALGLLKS